MLEYWHKEARVSAKPHTQTLLTTPSTKQRPLQSGPSTFWSLQVQRKAITSPDPPPDWPLASTENRVSKEQIRQQARCLWVGQILAVWEHELLHRDSVGCYTETVLAAGSMSYYMLRLGALGAAFSSFKKGLAASVPVDKSFPGGRWKGAVHTITPSKSTAENAWSSCAMWHCNLHMQ